ncbi:MAG: AraC family transcriptional regulator [Xanthobacteraceae bacterium]|nr:AraC family transcriptional regulator [Xanthobacteraceae bacterium]
MRVRDPDTDIVPPAAAINDAGTLNMYRPTPNLMQRVHLIPRIAAVVEVLEEEGIGASRALADTGLDQADLRSPDTRVSYRQVEAVFRNATRLTKDPTIPFRAGQRMNVCAYGMFGYALLSSPTRTEGIKLAVKYSRRLGMVVDVAFSRDDDTATYILTPLLSRNSPKDVYRFALEFAFATCLTFSTDVYGPLFKFSCLRASYPAPPHVDLYQSFFGCPVLFGQAGNEMEFDAGWVDHPMVRSDPAATALAADMCEPLLDDVNRGGGIAADLRRAMIARPGWFPSIEAMAAEMSVHPRTLRRKLEAEQITYRQVIAEVRMKLAIEYLRSTEMTNQEIAARLDYSDAANFRHAFTRWTRKSPSAFRQQQEQEHMAVAAHTAFFVPK